MTESHTIMAGSVKLNGYIENDPDTKTESICILWGETQKNDTEKKENGFLCAD